MTDPEPTCSTCRYWLDAGKGDFGSCRRTPPTVVLDASDGFQLTRFPVTRSGDLCGEHPSLAEDRYDEMLERFSERLLDEYGFFPTRERRA